MTWSDLSFSINAAELPLDPRPLDPQQIRAGSPQTFSRVLWKSVDGRHQRGVWEITPGVVVDVEVDEMFVVISGSATVEIEGQAPLRLAPGHVGVLRAGDRTTWHIHETLRKVYHLTR
jgi:uncharacterized protein